MQTSFLERNHKEEQINDCFYIDKPKIIRVHSSRCLLLATTLLTSDVLSEKIKDYLVEKKKELVQTFHHWMMYL